MNVNLTIWLGRILAALNIGFFWVLPISPVVSVAALQATKHSPGTHRRKMAVSGALLSASFTLFCVSFVAWQVVSLWR